MSAIPPEQAQSPVLAFGARLFARALNSLLDLDTDTRAQLAALDGRALTVDFKGTSRAMRIVVVGDRLEVGPGFAGDSALRVGATPGALLSALLARGRDGGIAPGTIDISGDAELARRLERIATRFAPDFDEAFARVFGDVAGFQIARGMRKALGFARRSARRFAEDASEYLVEESRDLVARGEIDAFLDDVDDLRERADRLEARVRRISTSSGARNG